MYAFIGGIGPAIIPDVYSPVDRFTFLLTSDLINSCSITGNFEICPSWWRITGTFKTGSIKIVGLTTCVNPIYGNVNVNPLIGIVDNAYADVFKYSFKFE